MYKLKFFIIYSFIIVCLTFTDLQSSTIDISKLHINENRFTNSIIQYDVTDHILYNRSLEIPKNKHFTSNQTIQTQKDINKLNSENKNINILNPSQKTDKNQSINRQSTLTQKIPSKSEPNNNINQLSHTTLKQKQKQSIAESNAFVDPRYKLLGQQNNDAGLKNQKIEQRYEIERLEHDKILEKKAQQNFTSIFFQDEKQPKVTETFQSVRNFSDLSEKNYVNELLGIKPKPVQIVLQFPQITNVLQVRNYSQNFPTINEQYSLTNQILNLKQDDKYVPKKFQENQNQPPVKINIQNKQIQSPKISEKKSQNNQIVINSSFHISNEIQNKQFVDQILELKEVNKFEKKQIPKQQAKIPQAQISIKQQQKQKIVPIQFKQKNNKQLSFPDYLHNPNDIKENDFTSEILNIKSQDKYIKKQIINPLPQNIPLPKQQQTQKINPVLNDQEQTKIIHRQTQNIIFKNTPQQLPIITHYGKVQDINQKNFINDIFNITEDDKFIKKEISNIDQKFKNNQEQIFEDFTSPTNENTNKEAIENKQIIQKIINEQKKIQNNIPNQSNKPIIDEQLNKNTQVIPITPVNQQNKKQQTINQVPSNTNQQSKKQQTINQVPSNTQQIKFRNSINQLPILYEFNYSPTEIADFDYTNLILNITGSNNKALQQIQKRHQDANKKQEQQIRKKNQQIERQKNQKSRKQSEEKQRLKNIVNGQNKNDNINDIIKSIVFIFLFLVFIVSAGICIALKLSDKISDKKQGKSLKDEQQQTFQQQLQQFYEDDENDYLEVRKVKPQPKSKAQNLLSSHDDFIQIMQSQQI